MAVWTTAAAGAWEPLTFQAEGWAPLKIYKWIGYVVSVLNADLMQIAEEDWIFLDSNWIIE